MVRTQELRDTSYRWSSWLERKAAESGATRYRIACEYRDTVGDDVDISSDGRRRRRAAPPKSDVTAWMRGRVPSPRVVWRIGETMARLGAHSSGIEALIAAGYRSEVLATAGIVLMRWFVDGCHSAEGASTGPFVEAAAIAVEDVIPVNFESSLTRIRSRGDVLNKAWLRWQKSPNPAMLWPRYAAACIMLRAEEISIARMILTADEYHYGATDFFDEATHFDHAFDEGRRGNYDLTTYLSETRFETPRRRSSGTKG